MFGGRNAFATAGKTPALHGADRNVRSTP